VNKWWNGSSWCTPHFQLFSLSEGFVTQRIFGGADNKAYQMVIAEKPYGPNLSVINLQSIGYVQKRSKTEETCERKDR